MTEVVIMRGNSLRPFARQVAVVTGASSGIGRAIALDLAARGAALALVGRKPGGLEEVAEAARAAGARTVCYQCDLAVDDDIRKLAARLPRDFGCVDILVHAAGVVALGPLESAPVEVLDAQYRVNSRGPYVLTQALLPILRVSRGQIVFINSTVALAAREGVGAYAATKRALAAIADSLRDEVNADGVRVLSVFVGRTATPMQAAIHAAEGRSYHPDVLLQPADVAAVVSHALALPRTAEVTEIRIRPMKKLPRAMARGLAGERSR